MSRSVLVTGGAGFIGSHLVRQLIGSGYDVHVLDPYATPQALPAGVICHQGSILDDAALEKAMAGRNQVFHLAANARLWARDPAIFDAINHQGTKRVIMAAKKAGVRRLVATSTALILRDWRDRDPSPIAETDPKPALQGMAGPYSRSKWHADEALRRAMGDGLEVVILYPTVPIGSPNGFITEPTEMLKGFLFNPPPAYLKTALNLIDVAQTAQAHRIAAEKAPANSRFILAGETIEFQDLLAILHHISNKAMPRISIPWWVASLAGQSGDWTARVTGKAPAASVEAVKVAKHPRRFDIKQAQTILDWAPMPAKEAITRTAKAILGHS
ncbi:dihydroflavonol-4-reductase [Iodidimonas muriae]|uniref:Dihydroflavonol-4-reductase n=1 Tax=Iodidimonas muriae TaxID=261467 RepID=A0ABQ2L5Z2_9PROT|nr:NAD-dependent epimerase/dehydratase family protein [Iodidimonas muriae]GER06309.1 dihydroflavonol-4-reductase [Kordiimonadales bacterium JCM 17843]GGO04249.1 dihydroflavonol-4-reductase [Iodidimonas muriae]